LTASDAFAAFPREQLAPFGRLVFWRMFGKTGVFRDGVMFGIVSDDTLYLRVDGQNRAGFEEASGMPPLAYQKGGRMIDLSFWPIPDRLLDEPEDLLTWVHSARRVVAGRKPAGPRPTSPGRSQKARV
jgi:DNA transformation protein